LADHVNAARGLSVLDHARSNGVAAALVAMTSADAATPLTGTVAAAGADVDPFGFVPVAFDFDAAIAAPPSPGWIVEFRPAQRLYETGNDPCLLLRELVRLGAGRVGLNTDDLPPLDALGEGAHLGWTIEFGPDVAESAIREVFEFVDGDCALTITPAGAAAAAEPVESAALMTDDLSTASAPILENAPVAGAAQTGAAASAQPAIRVDLDRIDKLINVVGELVIQQAMLAQSVAECGIDASAAVRMHLEDLELLTREIQDSVMAIRAQPVKAVFQRMPRLVREVAAMTGKAVRMVTEGENTEVDKTVIERLGEPITHMIRNAIDHGLEDPAGRRAAGKPEEGVIKLSAQHRSGRIVIEVSDDGRGINREKVRKIAIERGLISAEAPLSADEIDNLIFLPGFSTANVVSDISGRGVGMDVVKRSIQQLGGRIVIASQPGGGSTFTMSLPLTLAVLDGMVVEAGGQTLLAPLPSVIESFTPKPGDIHRIGPGDSVIRFRDRRLPVIDAALALGFAPTPSPGKGIAIVVENEAGAQAALWVDAIHGQKQVVIKSLETNYRKVDGISAATILGDGRVALILDIDALIQRERVGAADLLKAS
jgi:two-component system chemotaxis sensor kinase CheA